MSSTAAGILPGTPVVSRSAGLHGGRARVGFTLIELLISIMVFGVVLIAINTVFYSALRLRNRSAIAVDNSYTLEQAVGILRHDLQNVLPPDGTISQWFIIGPVSPYANMAAANNYGNNSNTNSNISMGGVTQTGMSAANNNRLNTAGSMQTPGIQFFTTTGVINDIDQWGDVQRVTYQLQAPLQRDAIGKDLVRSVSRDLLTTTGIEDPVEERILSNVDSFEVDCFTGTQWLTTWDTTLTDTGLPNAVRIRIQFASEDRAASRSQQPLELIMPFFIQAVTNSVDTSTNSVDTTQ
jgi:prepilin-type N-terminal cleavage/methylation domain-containing protein